MIRRDAQWQPLMLFAIVLLFCCAQGTAAVETWEPISTGFATDILISTSGANTSGEVKLTCPNTGYRVTDWGEVTRNGSEFSVDVNVERWTGVSAQMITFLKHTYALGALAPGTYTFTVKAYGSVKKTEQFSISAPSANPRLLTEANTERAIALESVTLTREPFSLVSEYFSLDRRSRAILFATDIELGQGDFSNVTAQAEDSRQNTFPLTVEYAGKVPNLDWLTQVIIKLPAVENPEDIWVTINVRGVVSNRVIVSVPVLP